MWSSDAHAIANVAVTGIAGYLLASGYASQRAQPTARCISILIAGWRF